jgi:hypothetical protein
MIDDFHTDKCTAELKAMCKNKKMTTGTKDGVTLSRLANRSKLKPRKPAMAEEEEEVTQKVYSGGAEGECKNKKMYYREQRLVLFELSQPAEEVEGS